VAQTAQSVTFPSGTRKLDAYLARPEGNGPFPALVVIHEAFGLNENIKDITRRFANEGYVALGVDLFVVAPQLGFFYSRNFIISSAIDNIFVTNSGIDGSIGLEFVGVTQSTQSMYI